MGLADLKNGMSMDASEGDTMLGQDLSPDTYIGPGNAGEKLAPIARYRENIWYAIGTIIAMVNKELYISIT